MEYSESYIKFGEYISELFGKHFEGMNQTDIAIKLNTQQGQISKWYKGERLPSDNMIKKIKEVTGLDIADRVLEAKRGRDAEIRNKRIRGGKSIDSVEVEQMILVNNQINDKKTKPRLPVKVAAGMIAEYYDGVLEKQCERTPIIKQFPSYDFTMIVQGDSMEPKFEGGDEIACEKISKIIEPGKTYLIDTKDGAFLKRAYPDENGIKCVSYNPQYSDFYIEKEDINGVYRVVGLIRFNI